MSVDKKYYWIKIKDSFMTSDKVDFLMSQKDGANYVVLYQMLCLMCLNTNGELSRKIGEIIIPYDVEKITRDCKYFSKDTVVVALEFFRKLGMIYAEENGTLVISDFENMVGSSKQDDHTKKLAAERQAKFRQKIKQNVIESVTVTQEVTDDVTLKRNTDIRDKILDNNIIINNNIISKNKYVCNESVELCEKLLNYCKNENPHFTTTKKDKWTEDIGKIHFIDGYSWEDIGKVIDFAKTDNFWKANILSGDKLRKQMQRLYLQTSNKNQNAIGWQNNNSYQSNQEEKSCL